MKSKGISLVLCMVMALSGFFAGGYATADTAHASSRIVNLNMSFIRIHNPCDSPARRL